MAAAKSLVAGRGSWVNLECGDRVLLRRRGIDRVVEAVSLCPVHKDKNGLPSSWIIYTPGGALGLSDVSSWEKTWPMRGKK